jgi:DNA/RNA non-specific endonuclease
MPLINYTEETKSATWKNAVSCKVVTKAVAQLTSTTMTGGSGPDQDINPPGWWSGDCPTHHQRGHLIGNNLGGPGDEAKNLVTLTAGTNHPFMYEFEDCVRRCVLANPGKVYTYTVECDYAPTSYTAVSGFEIAGAGGNPFCLFPAPAFLTLSLMVNASYLKLGDLVQYLPKPPQDLGLAAAYTHLRVANGGYKFYSSPTHIANSCWAVEKTFSNVKSGAVAYAKALGHLT